MSSLHIHATVKGSDIVYTSEQDSICWFNSPLTLYTDYQLTHTLTAVVLNPELLTHKILLINNLYYSVTEYEYMNLSIVNLNERPLTLSKGSLIGTIHFLGK